MTQDTTQTKRWKSWLLVASLALNLAFISIVVGVWLRDDKPARNYTPSPGMMRELVQAVPESQRTVLREDLKANRQQFNAFRQSLQAKHVALIEALGAQDFDLSRVVAILDDHRVVVSEINTNGHKIIIRRIENMSSQERQDFAQNLRTLKEKRKAWHKKHKQGGGSR